MKHPPDPTKIANELRGASAFFRTREADAAESTGHSIDQSIEQSINQSINPPIEPSIDQVADYAIGKPIEQSIGQTTPPEHSEPSPPELSRILSRPKGFYITEGIDQQLDAAVHYLQERHHIRKVDRSVVLTALLSDKALWSDQSIDRLADRVVDQLTSRLVGRS